MKDKLTDFRELMPLLGYKDPRSVARWCQKHRLPVYKMGKKSYVPSQLLTDVVDNQLVIFEKRKQLTKVAAEKVNKKRFKPQSEIVSQYLQKYESNCKSQVA